MLLGVTSAKRATACEQCIKYTTHSNYAAYKSAQCLNSCLLQSSPSLEWSSLVICLELQIQFSDITYGNRTMRSYDHPYYSIYIYPYYHYDLNLRSNLLTLAYLMKVIPFKILQNNPYCILLIWQIGLNKLPVFQDCLFLLHLRYTPAFSYLDEWFKKSSTIHIDALQ